MATYSFLKQAEVYVVVGSASAVRLDVTSDISFSQTFTDKTYPQKTLHEQHKMHDASNIKKANPADFEFTIPALTQSTLDTIFNLLVDYKTGTNTLNTFTLYIKLPNDIYMLENCVITNGTFLIEKLEKTGVPIVIKAGKSATQGFQFNLLNCSFTNRNNVADVFTQSYDWKMNDNPTDLGDGTSTSRSYITHTHT